MSSFFVGCRVRDQEGFKATVRYIGPVIAAKDKTETWIGVEWDDKTRGKHDGSCLDESGQVHRYFKCDFGAGSFIKPSKLSRGRSFSEALVERYVDLKAPSIVKEGSVLPDAFVTTSKGNQKTIEFVGEDNIRQRQQISVISKVTIRNDFISCAGEELATIASHLTELDLQDNLICQWSEVVVWLEYFGTACLSLLLGRCVRDYAKRIHYFPTPWEQTRGTHSVHCRVDSKIALLNTFLPNIEELYLANNDFSDIPSEFNQHLIQEEERVEHFFINGFVKLRILDISFCRLNDWSQIQVFGKLPALKELIMDGNAIANIQIPIPETFLELQRLSLGSTSVSAWSDLDNLASFSALHVLRISQIPLFTAKGASEVRPFVIGRIAKLTMLNGSVITARERRDAEKTYLRSVFAEKASLKGINEEHEIDQGLAILHPRFLELKALYEQEMAPAVKTSDKTNLASEMISITLKNMIIGTAGPSEPFTKKLPASLTVGKLRLLISQLYGIDPMSQHLALRIYKDSIPTELDDDQSSLQYYGAVDGADIFINERG